MPSVAMLTVAAVAGLLWGGAFGVPSGAHARATGLGSQGVARVFWLEALLLLSFTLLLPRFTRKVGWIVVALTGGYVGGILLGHLAGYQWGNFVGWHPD